MALFPGIVKIVPTSMLSCSPNKRSSKASKIEVKFKQIPRMARHFSESPQFLDMTSFSRIAEFVPPPVTSYFPDKKTSKTLVREWPEFLKYDVISKNRRIRATSCDVMFS